MGQLLSLEFQTLEALCRVGDSRFRTRLCIPSASVQVSLPTLLTSVRMLAFRAEGPTICLAFGPTHNIAPSKLTLRVGILHYVARLKTNLRGVPASYGPSTDRRLE